MKQETISNLDGFPSAGLYYSENMQPGQFGLDAFIKLLDTAVAGTPSGKFNWFTEFANRPWAVDNVGKLFSNNGSGWDVRRAPGGSGGNGLITDQTGRLLYPRTQMLGMLATDGTTYTDSWKDFGEAATEYRPADTYEDWVVFGNNNKLAVLNVTDDSFNAAAFTMPSGFVNRAVKSNRTGVLVAFNYQNRGVAFLWDVRTLRSISDWMWFDHKIQSVCKTGDGWTITTMKEQWLTNGYALVRKLPAFPDTLIQSQNFNTLPQGTLYTDGKLLTANTDQGSLFTRHKSGLYVLDLTTEKYTFLSPGQKADMTMGALFQDSSSTTLLSYSTVTPAAVKLVELKNDTPTQATCIVGPFGKSPGKKAAASISLELAPSLLAQSLFQNTAEIATADVSVKIYNFRRQLWAYGYTNAEAPATNKLAVSGTVVSFNNAKVGDEVTVLSGLNAGQIRHITAITGRNTTSEVWTLDSALPVTTESGVYLNIQPYQLVRKQTFTASNYEDMADLLFDVKNRIKGRKYLVKIVIENVTALPLTLQSVTLTYDEQGVNKTE